MSDFNIEELGIDLVYIDYTEEEPTDDWEDFGISVHDFL